MKYKLDQDSIHDNFFDNTRLLGIIAPIKNYTFCWHLNNILGVNFTLNSDIEIQTRKKNRDYFFEVYEWKEPESYLTHYLYNNQFDGEYLLPELRNMDFLWLMKGDWVEDEKCNQIINGIKLVTGVQFVTELSDDQIKNKTNLIY